MSQPCRFVPHLIFGSDALVVAEPPPQKTAVNRNETKPELAGTFCFSKLVKIDSSVFLYADESTGMSSAIGAATCCGSFAFAGASAPPLIVSVAVESNLSHGKQCLSSQT